MNNFMQTDENLCAALKKRVVQYKDAHPSMSSQQIAKRFDMPASSLNRIENGDIKNPSIDQVLKILRGTGNSEDLVSYLEEFYPQIAETYKGHFATMINTKIADVGTEDFFMSENSYKIMLLAFSTVGTDRSFISRKFGEDGVSKLNEMLMAGVLKEINGVILGDESNVSLTQSGTYHLLKNSLSTAFHSTEQSYLTFQSESVNEKLVLNKIIPLLEELNLKVSGILDDPINKGNDLFWFGTVADTLFKPSSIKGRQ